MCILFDAVNPVWQFKRGTVFDEESDDPFPNYDPKDDSDLTESDEDGHLQPYKPGVHTYVQSIAPSCLLH